MDRQDWRCREPCPDASTGDKYLEVNGSECDPGRPAAENAGKGSKLALVDPVIRAVFQYSASEGAVQLAITDQ